MDIGILICRCHDSAIKLFCLASLACSLDGKTNGSKKIISRPNPPKQCTQSALNTNAMGVYFGHRFNANKKGRHPDFSLHSLVSILITRCIGHWQLFFKSVQKDCMHYYSLLKNNHSWKETRDIIILRNVFLELAINHCNDR